MHIGPRGLRSPNGLVALQSQASQGHQEVLGFFFVDCLGTISFGSSLAIDGFTPGSPFGSLTFGSLTLLRHESCPEHFHRLY